MYTQQYHQKRVSYLSLTIFVTSFKVPTLLGKLNNRLLTSSSILDVRSLPSNVGTLKEIEIYYQRQSLVIFDKTLSASTAVYNSNLVQLYD